MTAAVHVWKKLGRLAMYWYSLFGIFVLMVVFTWLKRRLRRQQRRLRNTPSRFDEFKAETARKRRNKE